MKRIIAIISFLCLICATACASEADEFTIRNGIKFGMTPDEVIAIEGEEDRLDEGYEGHYYSELCYRDVFMGSYVKVEFAFGSNGLQAIIYEIKDEIFQINGQPFFDVINDILREKYGHEEINMVVMDDETGEEIKTALWKIPQSDRTIEILHIITGSQENFYHAIRYIDNSVKYMYSIEDLQMDADIL